VHTTAGLFIAKRNVPLLRSFKHEPFVSMKYFFMDVDEFKKFKFLQ
jgi:hypothetical protein